MLVLHDQNIPNDCFDTLDCIVHGIVLPVGQQYGQK
jgi:hypothetical protein